MTSEISPTLSFASPDNLDALQSPAAATEAADCDGVFARVWTNDAVEIRAVRRR